jgi:hypothetical protein
MGQKTSRPQPKKIELSTKQNEFAIYVLPNNEKATLDPIHLEVAAHGSNAILLFPDPTDTSSSSSGARKYNASYMEDGHWINEAGTRKEVSIGNRDFSSANFSPLSVNPDIKLLLPNTPRYQMTRNAILAFGGIQSSFEKLPQVIHANVIAPHHDIKSLVAVERSSRTLHGFYRPEKIKGIVKKLLNHAVYATADDIQAIKNILDKSPNHPYLRELLFTTGTVKRYDGRVLENRTLYQIALGAREYNVTSENGKPVVNGLIEMLGEYFKKLPDGETLRKQQQDAQFPEGFEEIEKEKMANDSRELNRMIKTVSEATDDECQQTMALDSFHGYDLRPSSWAVNNDEVLASAIYLESAAGGLACRWRGLDGQVKTKTISWDDLKDIPHSIEDILKDKNTCLATILEQLADPGQFYTAKQIEELKALSDAVVTARSPDDFDRTWNALQAVMKKIAGEWIPIHFTVLEALYQFRNYLEPKEVYTTGHHSNPQLLSEAYQLYDNHYLGFGDNWFSPKNVLCAQKIVGLVQRGLSACELQLHAQGLFSVLRYGNQSKRTFSFAYGGGSILPFDSDRSFRLGYNYWAAGAWGERWYGPRVARRDGPLVLWTSYVKQKHHHCASLCNVQANNHRAGV